MKAIGADCMLIMMYFKAIGVPVEYTSETLQHLYASSTSFLFADHSVATTHSASNHQIVVFSVVITCYQFYCCVIVATKVALVALLAAGNGGSVIHKLVLHQTLWSSQGGRVGW